MSTIVLPREGVDRCDCGVKYWDQIDVESWVCHSCRTPFRIRHVEPVTWVETRGYWVADNGVYSGWFSRSYKSDRVVLRRKVSGRNTYVFRNVDDGFFVRDETAVAGKMTRWGWAQ